MFDSGCLVLGDSGDKQNEVEIQPQDKADERNNIDLKVCCAQFLYKFKYHISNRNQYFF